MTRSLPQTTPLATRATQPMASAPPAFDERVLVWLRDLLATFCGVHLDTTQQRVLEQAVARRMLATGESLPAYQQRLANDRAELRQLAELVVNHETFFFRNQPHIRALHQVLLPEIHRRKPAGVPIRIWSAGCSTGEEAYSLAMVALEALPLANRPIEVWATDLSSAALAVAQAGVYAGRSLSQVSPTLLNRYFVPHGNGYQVSEPVRALVGYEQRNLLDPLPARVEQIDIVFCQNVLIYFEQHTVQALLGRLFERLPADAMLFLGFSETLWTVFDAFHTREVLGAYVYYKEAFSAKPVPPPIKRAAQAMRPLPPPMVAPRSQPPRAAASDATNGQAQFGQAQQLLASGQSDQALVLLQAITAPAQIAAAAHTLVARVYADRGEIAQAQAAANQALALDPLHSPAALLLGILHSRQGCWHDAIVQFERARYLDPVAPLISFYLAEALRQANRWSAALREYRNTLWKLAAHPPDTLLDGVAVGWLRESCQRYITQLSQHHSEQ